MKNNDISNDEMESLEDFFMFNEDDNLYSPNFDDEENQIFYEELINCHKMTHEEAVSVINSLQK